MNQHTVKTGDVHHRLTILSVKPFILQCICGTITDKYKPSHVLTGGLKSCGCLRYVKPMSPGSVFGTIKVLRCLKPNAKAVARTYDVECLKCGSVQAMSHTSINDRYVRKFGCMNCLLKYKESKQRMMKAAFSTRIALGHDTNTFMRDYCEQHDMMTITFIRMALKDMLTNMQLEEAGDIQSHAEVYGKLSKESFVIDITADERTQLEEFCVRMNMRVSRSIARLVRHAVTRYCKKIAH